MPAAPALVWFRQDLRLADNPALHAAIAHAKRESAALIPLYIWAPSEDGDWPPGAVSRVWLDRSLRSLDSSLRQRDSRLVIRAGPSLAALEQLIHATKAGAVFWNRRYEPATAQRDAHIDERLGNSGIHVQTFNSALLNEPETIHTKDGKPFQVFTPYWNACLNAVEPEEPLAAPGRIAPPGNWPKSLSVDELDLLPTIKWDAEIRRTWTPGETGAQDRLQNLCEHILADYPTTRDEPAIEGTSQLSPHLHFGEIGPRQVWHAVSDAAVRSRNRHAQNAQSFLRELCWRDFNIALLHHFPRTTTEPLRKNFARFPWRRSARDLRAWKRGLTGYPIVDAGMRQLWRIGWMHNRVRMITASFLIKHLLLPWQEGARWFWDTLVDADLANNTMNWQWVAGSGADAAPYFRIFNPVLQGEKFDPQGQYVRTWVPQLGALPAKFIHQPWNAPPAVLKNAGVNLGTTYPRPIVDHTQARQRALAAFQEIKAASA